VLTVDDAIALGGPDWVIGWREEAADRLAAVSPPSAEDEVWRYSRVAEIDPSTFVLPPQPPAEIPSGLVPLAGAITERAALVVLVDGHIVHTEIDEHWASKGLVVGSLGKANQGERALGAVSGHQPNDLFAAMNDAFFTDPVLVHVPDGVRVEPPVVVAHWTTAAGTASFPRTVVDARPGSDCTVLEYHGSDDVQAFIAPMVELDVHPSARLGYLGLQDLGRQVQQVATQVSRVRQEAHLVSAQAALGGDYARVRSDCRLEGRGASGDLLAVYFGAGTQMHDFRTFQEHIAPDTTSDLLFKGAVAGTSQSVYTGLIHVGKEARGTNAFQTNRNLKLGDGAWAESVPNLEIENNEVHCSHASTVGPVDEEQRFYLESRGVPPQVAERLIVAGFFDEVITRMPVPAVAPALRARVQEKIDEAFSDKGAVAEVVG
jgi:Fe-S cluster assembly protein SufD